MRKKKNKPIINMLTSKIVIDTIDTFGSVYGKKNGLEAAQFFTSVYNLTCDDAEYAIAKPRGRVALSQRVVARFVTPEAFHHYLLSEWADAAQALTLSMPGDPVEASMVVDLEDEQPPAAPDAEHGRVKLLLKGASSRMPDPTLSGPIALPIRSSPSLSPMQKLTNDVVERHCRRFDERLVARPQPTEREAWNFTEFLTTYLHSRRFITSSLQRKMCASFHPAMQQDASEYLYKLFDDYARNDPVGFRKYEFEDTVTNLCRSHDGTVTEPSTTSTATISVAQIEFGESMKVVRVGEASKHRVEGCHYGLKKANIEPNPANSYFSIKTFHAYPDTACVIAVLPIMDPESHRKRKLAISDETELFWGGPDHKRPYTLTGVVIHRGPHVIEGHYIAALNYNNVWYLVDDTTVSTIRDWRAIRGDAYILLYTRTAQATIDKPRGIPNYTDTCYFNAVMQLVMRAETSTHDGLAAPRPAAQVAPSTTPNSAATVTPLAPPTAATPASLPSTSAYPAPVVIQNVKGSWAHLNGKRGVVVSNTDANSVKVRVTFADSGGTHILSLSRDCVRPVQQAPSG